MKNLDKNLIESYLDLGWKIFSFKSEELKYLRFSNDAIKRNPVDSTDVLSNFNPQTDSLGLDLKNSNLLNFSVSLSDIEIFFSRQGLTENREDLINLFSSVAPIVYDKNQQRFNFIFKNIDELQRGYSPLGHFYQDMMPLPHTTYPTLQYRSSWLFPEKNLMNSTICEFSEELPVKKSINKVLDSNKTDTDNPMYFYHLINTLPKALRKPLGV